MYDKKSHLHPDVQASFFSLPVAALANKSTANLEIWLSQVTMLMSSSHMRNPHRDTLVTDFFSSTARLPGFPESFLSSRISSL